MSEKGKVKKCDWCKEPVLKKNNNLCKECSDYCVSMNFHIGMVNGFLERPVENIDLALFGLRENVKEVNKKVVELVELKEKFKAKSIEKIKIDRVETVKDMSVLLKEIKRLKGGWETFFDCRNYGMLGKFYESQNKNSEHLGLLK